ncbi:MAG TPA: GAF domain-containing protein, partial [Anaerolineae bacterium]|nr:GAF domain-containing protein [Anaerolineae bacterium]
MERYGSYLVSGSSFTDKSMVMVPLVAGDQARGLIDLFSLEHEHAFSESDVRLLETLANSMSVALENARLFDETQRLLKETEQRNAELAIINSVQKGLASKLDMQAIYDLVGDKIREIFDAQAMVISTGDYRTQLMHMVYVVENGQRYYPEPRPLNLDTPVTRALLQTRQPLVANTLPELEALGVPTVPGTLPSKSAVWTPLFIGDELRDVISLQSVTREYAFSESDVRLLQTLANSMSVALESARQFNETQRLLKETEQRNAELKIINSVQAGIASKLDAQAIYDLVGDKLREIFHEVDVTIGVYDPQTDMAAPVYLVENGQRLHIPPFKVEGIGFMGELVRRPHTIVINENMDQALIEYGSRALEGTSLPKSMVDVPLVIGGRLRGILQLQDMNREQAFSESDVRLLETIASSVSIALESARLFDETQRLLKITEERAEELSIINSVQASLAAQLDIQAIFDLVGDKIRDTFDAQGVNIATYDRSTNLIHFSYIIEKGQRHMQEPLPLSTGGFTYQVMHTRQPLMINEDLLKRAAEVGSVVVGGGEEAKSGIWVPLIVGTEARGAISIQNIDREHAFDESDLRLLTTLASSLSVSFENARLFDETQRLLKETDQRAAELALINSVQAGLASKLDFLSIIDLVGDKVRDIFGSHDLSIGLYDHATNILAFPYYIEGGKRFTIEPIELSSGFSAHVIQTHQPLMINEHMMQRAAELGARRIGDMENFTDLDQQSILVVPILKGDEAIGVLTLYENH